MVKTLAAIVEAEKAAAEAPALLADAERQAQEIKAAARATNARRLGHWQDCWRACIQAGWKPDQLLGERLGLQRPPMAGRKPRAAKHNAKPPQHDVADTTPTAQNPDTAGSRSDRPTLPATPALRASELELPGAP
ncbi:hypothetical protein GCM10022247_34640 [Allokutzneria multivorans]|uniref:Uncharacterized protein n=2 Tax=Allokutzneria multivorans TaxID=1142134 RepID=A0ABP7SBH3_9PSEU